MARHSLTPVDSNTPWWHQTPSLVSQSSYGQSSFTGVTMSQSTDPLNGTFTSESTCFSDTSTRGDKQQEDNSDEDSPRSFLITTVESDTGQSSVFLSSDFEPVTRPKQNPSDCSFSHSTNKRWSLTMPKSKDHNHPLTMVTTRQIAPPTRDRFHSTANIDNVSSEWSLGHPGPVQDRLSSWSGSERVKQSLRQRESDTRGRDDSQLVR